MASKGNLPSTALAKLTLAKVVLTTNEGNDFFTDRVVKTIKGASLKTIANNKLSVSLKLYDPNVNCLSSLNNDELRTFSEFCTTIRDYSTPSEIVNTKFNCTTDTNKDELSKALSTVLKEIGYCDEQLEVHHYKLSFKARIHGIWKESRFKLIWIDPNHELHK